MVSKMIKTFVTADLHLGHERVIELEPHTRSFSCIEEHDETIIERWNRIVRPRDIVWVLGDVAYKAEDIEKVGRLNGDKRLVLGNHDNWPIDLYLKHFTRVYGSVRLNRYILSHMPVHASSFRESRSLLGCVHGHMHSSRLVDRRYINVSMDCTNLEPVLLQDYIDAHHESEIFQREDLCPPVN